MKRVVITWVLLAGLPPLRVSAVDPPAGRESGEAVLVAGNGTLISMNNQSRRRGRKRPKRRGGSYEVIEVTGGGVIQGVIIYRGEVPEPEQIQIVKDHETCDHREKTRPLIRVNDEGRVAESIVFLGDIKAGKAIPVPEEKPVFNQRHCTFEPHVQVLIKRQPFEIVNSDPVAHNAKCVQHMMTLFNPMQPKRGMRNEFTLKRSGLANLTCAVHNWMKAYAYVLWHPYYAVTGADGSFEITDIPPGEYELVVWQEHLGEQSKTVAVETGKTTVVEIELIKE